MSDETVLACPRCDSARIWGRSNTGANSQGRWRCKECQNTFDDGVERPPKSGGRQATHSLARRLEHATSSEVSGDD